MRGGDDFEPQGQGAMSVSMFGCHTPGRGGGTSVVYWEEARLAANPI